MTNERTLIAALVADMAAAHDECLGGWHESSRDTLLGAMQAGNAFLATPSATAEPIAWYSPRHGDTLTDKQKTERAAYVPLDAAAYSVPLFSLALFTGAPEQSHAVSYMEGISDGRAEVGTALVPLTNEQIVAAARALNKLSAESCNVDEVDSWALYGDSYLADAAVILKAAHGVKP